MAKREIYHSSKSGDGSWKVTKNGEIVSTHATQADAEQHAGMLGRRADAAGGLGQAVLHKMDGAIREERTYGKDPRDRKG